MRRAVLPLVLPIVVLAAAAGCGGDDSEPDGATPTTAAPTTVDVGSPTSVDGVAVIAHRGASAYAPEHTFAAYDLALDQGADYLEQDLQLTADGALVVLHDDTLDRTARGPAASCTGPVADKTLDQLRECEVGSWFNEAHPDRADPAYAELRIPEMGEVLDRYGTDVRYYIEIKSPGASPGMEEALLDALDRAGLGSPTDDSRQVLVQSFSAESLQRLHALRPELPLVQLMPYAGAPVDPAVLDDIAGYAVAIGPAAEGVDQALVDAAHERCLAIHPYTVDDPEEMGALVALGVDGLFTDAPDVLRSQLADVETDGLDCEPTALAP